MRTRLVALIVLLTGMAFAQDQGSFQDPTGRVFQLVLPPGHLFGDLGGLRSRLEESGIVPRLMLVSDVAGRCIRQSEPIS